MELNKLTVTEAQEGLAAKKFSAVELTEACLRQVAARDSELNAFITVSDELAFAEAAAADQALANGTAQPLTGIPFSVKDAICTLGVRSTGAAKILDNYLPPFESTVISRLRAAGAVLVGKTNCDAFGHGASNENSMYGPVKNPYDTSKVAGGSSGGSAAAVADNMCLFSVAEDTGGSIRYPASLCGVVGLRPSYGRTSRYGSMPMGSSLDTVGPITKTAADAALIMNIIAGQDSRDATTVPDPVPDYLREIKQAITGLKIGIPKEYFEVAELNPTVQNVFDSTVERLTALGATFVPVSLPHTKYAVATYYIIVPCEDSSNLARLDGLRYGVRAPGTTLEEVYSRSRALGFPEEVKRRILIGTYALSAGYYDAYYKKAQAVRTLIKQDFDEVFTSVDALLAPTAPSPAFGLGEKQNDPLALYLADILVSPASLAGVPALSMPAGSTPEGLPIGMQLIGPRLGEGRILQIAHQFAKV